MPSKSGGFPLKDGYSREYFVNAARFLAKQAIEEFQHVGNFVRMQQMLGVKAGPAHPLVRFLARRLS